jgi:O-antigen ligase
MSSISPTNESPYAAPQSMSASPQYWKFVQNLFRGSPADAWLTTRSFPVPIFMQILGWGTALICLLNLPSVISRLIYSGRYEELPIYPIIVTLTMLFVLFFTKPRPTSRYFVISWAYYFLYIFFGFIALAIHYKANFPFKFLVEVTLKPFLALLVVPWIIYRTVSPDKLPRFQMFLTIATAIGALLSVWQLFMPGLFSYILASAGRGSGFWENPNAAGFIFVNIFFLSFIPNWKQQSLIVMIRVLLIAGIVVTMSRSALLFLPIAGMTYMFFCGKFKRLAGFSIGMVFFVIAFYTFAVLAESGTIPIEGYLKARITSILDIFRGNIQNQELQNSRFYLWSAGIEQLSEDGGLVTGMGHGGFIKIRKYDLSVHNDYVQHWGTAGIVGLMSLLMFYGSLLYAAYSCKNLRIRAGVISIVVTFMLFSWTGAAYFQAHTTGPILALVAMWLYYGRMCPSDDQAESVRRMVHQDMLRSVMPSRENRPRPGTT